MTHAAQQPLQAPPLEEIHRLLQSCPLFEGLNAPQREQVAPMLSWRTYAGGEAVIHQDEPCEGVLIVFLGALTVVIDHDRDQHFAPEEVVFRVARHQTWGEDGYFGASNDHRLVWASRDTELAFLSYKDLRILLRSVPDLLEVLARQAVAHAVALSTPYSHPPRATIAILPAHLGIDLTGFAYGLEVAIGGHKAVFRAQSRHPDAAILQDWERHGRAVTSWLAELEHKHSLILLVAAGSNSPWSAFCLRNADIVLIVGDAEVQPDVHETERYQIEKHAAADHVQRQLVLLHDSRVLLPNNTHQWLEHRPYVDQIHHVRPSAPRDMARLARHLLGTSVALVLGGGGARGAAHIGAVSALRDAGVPIDAVGGASSGAGIAAMVALGWTEEQMAEKNEYAMLTIRPFSKYTIPFHSFLRTSGVKKAAEYLFADTHIEDLWIPYFALAADIVQGRAVVLDRGPLGLAAMASTSLPGVLAPIKIDDKLLVDGGVLDNNPVLVMRGRRQGPTILIDVGQADAKLTDAQLPQLPSNLWSFWLRFKPFGRKPAIPTAIDIVMRTLTIGRPSEHPQKHADLYIRPQVDLFGLTNFLAQPALIRIGYNATVDALHALLKDEPTTAQSFGITAESLSSLQKRD